MSRIRGGRTNSSIPCQSPPDRFPSREPAKERDRVHPTLPHGARERLPAVSGQRADQRNCSSGSSRRSSTPASTSASSCTVKTVAELVIGPKHALDAEKGHVDDQPQGPTKDRLPHPSRASR